jgi:menaquinone-dependent protoporphyrinogen oxidase
MTTVLVAYATKHGTTAEIAASIARALRDTGVEVDLRPVEDVHGMAGYDAAIVGSAVYMGRWQRPALDLLMRFGTELRSRPTWLFSSGPIGGTVAADSVVARAIASPDGVAAPAGIDDLARRIGARGHATFPGRIGADMTGLLERWMPRGDWRDVGAVRGWARKVGAQLAA